MILYSPLHMYIKSKYAERSEAEGEVLKFSPLKRDLVEAKINRVADRRAR